MKCLITGVNEMDESDFLALSNFAMREYVPVIVLNHKPSRYRKYAIEQSIYKKAYETKVDDETALWAIKKLARHFKLSGLKVKFRGKRQSGRAWGNWMYGYITIAHNPSIGLIAHELAHIWDKQHHQFKKGKRYQHGSKGWLRLVGRIIKYVDKKKWFITLRLEDD